MRRVWMALFAFSLGVSVAVAQQQPPQSAGDAAKRAQEKKQAAPKTRRAFTNDDVEKLRGKTSTVGAAAAAPEATVAGETSPAQAASEDEAAWRKRFSEARTKLSEAQRELDILQRELNLLQQQYYSDPTKAMQEQYERKEVNEHRAKVEAKQKEVQQLRQAITDLEEELRKAGKPAAWARG